MAPAAKPSTAAKPPAPAAMAETASQPAATPEVLSESPLAKQRAIPLEIPTTCSGDDGNGCFPEEAFTERVCRGKYPDLPLALFAKGAPWQHRFVKAVSVEPVNAHGGPRSEAWMNFGEEVIVLRKRGPGGGAGVQISGPTDLDVLRWDGTCATVREEMFVSYVPGEMTSPRIVWKYLDDSIQDGLRKSPAIDRAQASERKQCRDSSPTKPTPACDQAMKKLTDAIVIAVRLGLEVPPPAAQGEPTALRFRN
jgi:hypothetical protein